MIPSSSDMVVFYHGGCRDGFTAAYCAYMVFPEATFFPVRDKASFEMPEVAGKRVLVLDMSFDRETTEHLARAAKGIMVLDHHVTSEEVLDGLPYCVFDSGRSGAGLAWDYLLGKDKHLCPFELPLPITVLKRPWWVEYTEDRDIWGGKFPDTDVMHEGLKSVPFNFVEFSESVRDMGSKDRIYKIGLQRVAYRDSIVTSHLNLVRTIRFCGYENVPVVNSGCLASDIGHAMLKRYPKAPFVVVWFENSKGDNVYCLRSEDHRVDVSEIARYMGGGGHRNAAGFKKREDS